MNFDELLAHGKERYNHRCQNPLTERQLIEQINSVLAKMEMTLVKMDSYSGTNYTNTANGGSND